MRRTALTCAALAGAAALLAAPAATAASAAPAGGGSGHDPGLGSGGSGPIAEPPKVPTAVGRGGAIATVDLDASRVGLNVLDHGGNAVDAAVAAAATLGVTEPFSAGIGGGGYFVVYDPHTHRVTTIDGRETAPKAFTSTTFTENGQPIPFADAVTSGLSVGVPGSLATWQDALRRYGTWPLSRALAGAEDVATRGFTVDSTFNSQVAQNADRFSAFTSTKALYLPGGQPPAVGSTFRNPDLARTYAEIARRGTGWLYDGELGAEIADTAQHPPVVAGSTRNVRPGLLTTADLAAYRTIERAPTHVNYRGLDVYGMAPSSSGGSTVGEALNILAGTDLSTLSDVQYLHRYLEATRLAFADRNRYVGDPAYVDVPLRQLLSPGFGAERSCLIDPTKAATSPVPPGSPDGAYSGCPAPSGVASADTPQGTNTTNLTVVDRTGLTVEYTLTIEQTGGDGIVVPGRGFLLNNELTDFDFVPATAGVPDPNLPAPGKRPRSSISPTIVLKNGRPWLALGSPGGATIITTVLQVFSEVVDRGLSLPAAIAVPRASQRNAAVGDAEPGFLAAPYAAGLAALGQELAVPAAGPEIGAATGIRFLPGGVLQAAAEPVRRGGGSALVVRPLR